MSWYMFTLAALQRLVLVSFRHFRAEEALVNLDHAADFISGIPRAHSHPEFVEHRPYRVVVPMAELTLEFRRRYALLRACQQVHGYEPVPDRKLAPVHHISFDISIIYPIFVQKL